MKHKQLKLFLAFNLILVVLEIVGLFIAFRQIGTAALVYYTQLSNMLLLLAAVVNVIFAGRSLWQKKTRIPLGVWRLFYAATSTVTVTFLVVVLVLSWMYGSLLIVLTSGSMLYTHTLCPLLAIAMFCYFAPKKFTTRDALWATSLTFLYGIVTLILNALRVMEGPYPFLMVYRQPLIASIGWVIVLIGGAYVVARLLLSRKCASVRVK